MRDRAPWEILAEDMTVTGDDSTWVRFAPMDGTAGASDGEGIAMESLYRPWGISVSEAVITARVDAEGEYAFLAYREFVEGGNSAYHSGKELTMSLRYTPFLVYDESRGTFDGSTDTVYVTVTGGGKSKTVPVVLTKNEILLGETKYYYVANVDGRPKIRETTSTSVPEDLMPGFEWGDDPVEVIERESNSGKRLGVYWERGKPIPNGSGILPDALIRLVGRHWHADSLYKVRLSASDSYGETARAVIQVKRPARLGDSPFAISRDHGIDIESRTYSVDSVCIKWGGIYGFPPQNIKGQYQSESVFDRQLQAYAPGYRYEPWSVEFWDEVQRLRSTSHFWVTNENMGDGDALPDHQNLRYMSYVNTPHTVWYFIEQYSTVVHDNPPAGYSLFGSFHASDGRLTFIYPRPINQYQRIRHRVYNQLRLNERIENRPANLIVRQRFIEEMSARYLGGLNNRPAQSRIASSYGPLQPMYTTALDRGYPNGTHDRPEDLNDPNVFFPFAMAHHVFLLTQQVGDISSNNWEAGFEETMRRVYHEWNGRPGYDTEVLTNARRYAPVR